ncbi:hypothetical protein [Gulosibacter chungangensis]|uniref:Extracellular solute-binding protein n=1 Tax=Gulosibacter chungangensis TaxID=979746 RepID=A0A7J5BBK9_9MICO|nr:hypothetical protein [Gulosibacter chungangensis]KAB1643485.1 hypothetical protein F8O05_06245 [Gulosibacter chungangensis]
MKLRTPHFIGIGLLVVGIIAVLVIQLTGIGRGGSPKFNLTVVEGVVSSEKAAFFEDPAVQEVFESHGYDVRVTKSGSWRMASLDGVTENDFAFPASEIAAENIANTHGSAVRSTHKPFFSPLAIATFEPIMTLLETNGAASKDASGRWNLDMAAYLELVEEDIRWNELEGAATAYNSPRSVLITSTDVRTSNSAGMYLSLAAYVLNNNAVVSSASEANAHMDLLTKLFISQGYSGASSTAPFDDYLSQGMGAVPMVMIYEGQFLEEQLGENSRIQDGMVLAYPTPSIFSVHTGVTFSEAGQEVMELLETDPELATLLAEHGFRPQGQNAAAFQTFLDKQQLTDYPTTSEFVNLAVEPSYEVLDALLAQISSAYDLSGAPPARPEEVDPADDSVTTNEDGTPQ